MLQHKKDTLLSYAMYYGMILGLFWALKYSIYIVSQTSIPYLVYLYYLLNGGSFLLIYVFYFKFRDAQEVKTRNLWHCFLFIILLCFFASFLEIAFAFASFKFINPTYFSLRIEPILKAVLDVTPQLWPMKAFILSQNFYFALMAFGNVFLGIILGGALTVIVGNKKK